MIYISTDIHSDDEQTIRKVAEAIKEIGEPFTVIRPILFQCDRRACKKCYPDCNYTTDIKHAKNFVKDFDIFTEQEARA